MRRLATIGALTALLVAGGALPAAAEELEAYLREADEAEFSGRQIVVTYWDGGESAAGVYAVAQRGGMTLVESGGLELMVGGGKMETDHAGGEGQIAMTEWSEWRLSDRYDVAAEEEARRLGRQATVVTVVENDRPRVRMVFDDATGAPLSSEVFDGDGDLYRMAVMVEFQPGAPPMQREAGPLSEYEVVARSTPIGLPDQLAGYWRADTYAGPDETLQAFYTDGIFSFSLFRADARLDDGPFADGADLDAAGNSYRRLLDPGAVRVFWNARSAAFVLVGDLPPDHLENVLADLPDPDRPNLLVRAWRGLFG